MQFDNIRVSRKLWGAFLGLMIGMLLLSSFAQNRGNNSMTAAMDGIIEIEERISSAVRWRGATETAVTMVMGGAVTTDSVLAEQYGAKVKEIIGNINKVQEKIVASATAPEEKAALDKVLEARKAVLAATAKTWELKGAGDAVATQRFADDEFAPLVTKYLKTQDDFVATLEKRRDAIRADAVSRRIENAVSGIILSMVLLAVGIFLAWRLVHSITVPLDQAVAVTGAINQHGEVVLALDGPSGKQLVAYVVPKDTAVIAASTEAQGAAREAIAQDADRLDDRRGTDRHRAHPGRPRSHHQSGPRPGRANSQPEQRPDLRQHECVSRPHHHAVPAA